MRGRSTRISARRKAADSCRDVVGVSAHAPEQPSCNGGDVSQASLQPSGKQDVTLTESHICPDAEGSVGEHLEVEPKVIRGKKRRERPSRGGQQPKRPKADADVEAKKFSSLEIEQIGENLLNWYDAVHRELPWRRNPDTSTKICNPEASAPLELPASVFAYRVWVSEVMLQQTQVATVIDYFNKWVGLWPDVESLEKATLDQVHEAWSGLGYYRRAGYLLSGAKYVVSNLGGKFPTTAEELLKIPGVGPYTSAAVASIAYGEPVGAVDGNVIRVVSRLRALEGDPKKLTKIHHRLAKQMLQRSRPGDFNQAVMELGATVCRPANPKCGECPLQDVCLARKKVTEFLAQGGSLDSAEAPSVTDYPTSVKKKAKTEQTVAICILRVVSDGKDENGGDENSGGFFLMVKRPEKGLLAGLWEFPTVSDIGEMDDKERKAAVVGMLDDRFGISVEPRGKFQLVERKDVGEAVHIFSHIRMTMKVESLVLKGNRRDVCVGEGEEMKWVASGDMPKQGLSTMVKKSWKICQGHAKTSKNSIRKYLAVKGE
ncbi:hypothetical protein BSKO_05952 [Bryopsis sp. KO-2023]|nr:hypothetical protein BSKO_05952 [Bryopsis sp. KO-2023]